MRIPSAAARARNTAATDFPSASPAATSLAAALPDQIAAFSCSAAFIVISWSSAGNNYFIISTVTTDNTASSDGYEGRSETGMIAMIALLFFAGDSRLY